MSRSDDARFRLLFERAPVELTGVNAAACRLLGPRRVVDDRTAFVEKPFTVETLLSRVRASLSPNR